MKQYVTALEYLTMGGNIATPKLWVAGKNYFVGDSCVYSSKVYNCIQAHTSVAGQTPDMLPSLWELGTETEDMLNDWLQYATVKIDEMTNDKIGSGFDRLTAFQQELIKKATIYQADYLYDNDQTGQGGWNAGKTSSWSITDVSMGYGAAPSSGSGAADAYAERHQYSPRAMEYLDRTGLTWRGV